VTPRIRDEVDGPMLLHGLQEMAGTQLLVPHQRAAQPDPERLAYRYEQFKDAS
jgi:putative restriction endonuclease